MTAPTSSGRERRPPEFFSRQVLRARRFYRELAPPPGRRLAVVCGGLEFCTGDYGIRRSTFPFHSLEYVARGQGALTLDGRPHVLRPGSLFSYGPGVPHEITSDPADPLVKYFVDFAGRGAPRLLRSCRLPAGSAAQVFPPHALSSLFDELIGSGPRPEPAAGELCVRLLECLALKIPGAVAGVDGSQSHAFATYLQCRQHIERNYLRLESLAQIAAETHASDAYLCRLFQRFDRQSPYQLLLRLKINHAAERLQAPDALVKRIAEEVGFPDPFHFSRVFRSVLGVPPRAFRGLRPL